MIKEKLFNFIPFFFFLIYCIYILSFNWGFFPLSEGFFLLAGKQMADGKNLYTDIYAYLPPLYYYLSKFIYLIDDPGFQLGRLIGFLLMLFFYPVVYLLNSSWVSNKFFLSTTTFFSLIIISSSAAFLSYDFTQFVIFFSLLGWLFISKDDKKLIFLSGLLIGLACLFKQSNGLVIFIFGLIYISFKYFKSPSYIFSFLLGFLFIVFIVFLPIALDGNTIVSLSSIIFEASNNKGGGVKSLYFWFTKGFYSVENLFAFLKIILIFGVVINFSNYLIKGEKKIYKQVNIIINLIIFSLLVFLFFKYKYIFFYEWNNYFWKDIFLVSGYIGFLLFLLKIFHGKFIINKIYIPNFSISLLNIALILGSGMSGGLTKTSIFFTVSFYLLFLMCNINKKSILQFLLFFTILIVSFFIVVKKYEEPYKWWEYDSGKVNLFSLSVYENSSYVHVLKIKNFLLSCNSIPSNLLSFPHMTSLNLIFDIPPFGKTTTLWFDFLSDNHAKEVLYSLDNDDLDSYIVWNPPKDVFSSHSKLFKGGIPLIHEEIYKKLLSNEFSKNYSTKDFIINGTSLKLFTKKELNCL